MKNSRRSIDKENYMRKFNVKTPEETNMITGEDALKQQNEEMINKIHFLEERLQKIAGYQERERRHTGVLQ